MARFLHTADLHLNCLRSRYTEVYLQRNMRTLYAIHDIAQEYEVDFTLVAGDLFQTTTIMDSERKALSEWINACPVPLIVISGNHDHRSEEVGDTTLSYLAKLDLGEHFVYDGLPVVCAMEDARCVLLLIPSNKWKDHELHLILQHLVPRATKKYPKWPVVVVLHEAVYGCVNDVGRKITQDGQIRIDEGMRRDFPEITYWALGDIHKFQEIQENAWYPGSPMQILFNETEEKGVLIVDTDDPTNPEFVRTPSAKLVSVLGIPDEWPDAKERILHVRSVEKLPIGTVLPDNVHCSAPLAPIRSGGDGGKIGIFDGLETTLLSAGLTEELVPMARGIAEELARGIGINIKTE